MKQKFGMGHHKSLAGTKLLALAKLKNHYFWYKYSVQSVQEFSLLWLFEVETLSPSLTARVVGGNLYR